MTKELGSLVQRMKVMRITDIDLDSLERYLNGLDKLERALVNRATWTLSPSRPIQICSLACERAHVSATHKYSTRITTPTAAPIVRFTG